MSSVAAHSVEDAPGVDGGLVLKKRGLHVTVALALSSPRFRPAYLALSLYLKPRERERDVPEDFEACNFAVCVSVQTREPGDFEAVQHRVDFLSDLRGLLTELTSGLLVIDSRQLLDFEGLPDLGLWKKASLAALWPVYRLALEIDAASAGMREDRLALIARRPPTD